MSSSSVIKKDTMESPSTSSPSLLDLPPEVRTKIWSFVLRPDCMFKAGPNRCLKAHDHRYWEKFSSRLDIITLNSIIYNETVVLLRATEVAFHLEYRGPPSFTSFPELQFRSLANITLIVDLPVLNPHFDPVRHNLRSKDFKCSVRPKLKDIYNALQRHKNLRSLTLLLNRVGSMLQIGHGSFDRQAHFRHDKSRGIPKLLLNITKEVYNNGGIIKIGRYDDGFKGIGHDAEPIVPWLLQAALEQEVYIERLKDPLPYSAFFGDGGLTNVAANRLVSDEDEQSWIFGILPQDFKAVTELQGRRVQVPECLSCGKIFETTTELENHRENDPSHLQRIGKNVNGDDMEDGW